MEWKKVKGNESFKGWDEIFKGGTKTLRGGMKTLVSPRKILDKINDSTEEKVSDPDLKIFEKTFDTQLENLQLYSLKNGKKNS